MFGASELGPAHKKLDARCVIKVDSKEKAKTSFKPKTNKPVWNEDFDFSLEGAGEIEFQVFDKNELYAIHFFDIKKLMDQPTFSEDIEYEMEPLGLLHISLSFGLLPFLFILLFFIIIIYYYSICLCLMYVPTHPPFLFSLFSPFLCFLVKLETLLKRTARPLLFSSFSPQFIFFKTRLSFFPFFPFFISSFPFFQSKIGRRGAVKTKIPATIVQFLGYGNTVELQSNMKKEVSVRKRVQASEVKDRVSVPLISRDFSFFLSFFPFLVF